MSFDVSPLDEIAEVVDSLHKTPSYVEHGRPMVRVTDVKYGELDLSKTLRVDDATFKEFSRRYTPSAGDIIITRVGTYGVFGKVVNPSFCLGQNTAAIIPKSISADYLYAVLNSDFVRSQIEAGVVGSTQKTLSLKAIKALKIPRMGASYEAEVASFSSALDDRITLLRETNATLEAIAQALFKSWFVDFDPVRAKMEGRTPEGMDEATAALFPDGFEASELGVVPRGWRSATMEDVSIVGIGKTPPRKEQHWFSEDSNDVRWVSIRDMGICGTYASTTSEFLTAEAVDKFNVRRVPDNTVLMSFKMTIGRVAITDGEMTTNEAIAHFRLDPASQLSTEFIYLHLRQFDFSKLSSTSSIADAVNSKTVRQIPILVPSGEVATAFQEQIGVVFEMLKSNEQQAQTLATLRDALLPRLISGQLRLPNAETEATTV